MRISILTLFPDMFSGPFDFSIVKRAKEKKLVTINIVNIRDFATDTYKSVDDHPYGGGVGMILRVDTVDAALRSIKMAFHKRVIPSEAEESHSQSLRERIPPRASLGRDDTHVVLLDPRGSTFTQKKAREYANIDHLVLVCGHYEGVDERVRKLVDESISIGDYVLTGGELPAMVITDAVVRLLPGVLKKEAVDTESFSLKLPTSNFQLPTLEYPQYTRPEEYKGMKVPHVLLSGNHKRIEEWRRRMSSPRSRG